MCVLSVRVEFWRFVTLVFFAFFKNFSVSVNVLVVNTFVLCLQCCQVSLIEVKIGMKSCWSTIFAWFWRSGLQARRKRILLSDFVKIENLAPFSKKWSSLEKMSILPKKLGETYLVRLASYFCMCSKLRFRSKFLSSSKFRSFSKFRSKFFKIGGSWGVSKIHLHCRSNFEKPLFWGVQKFWKTWIWISSTIEISISTEISDEISLFYTYKNMMQAKKDMFHPVFWEGLTFFRGNSIF